MKRRICVVLLALACLLIFAGCRCEHEWMEANCDTPKTCSLCGETEGAPLGHSWLAATCEGVKTCEICGETEGEPLGHIWVEATCAAPKHCERCNKTEGETLGHTWQNATTEAPKTCSECGATEGERIITDERFTTAANQALFGDWEFEMTMTGEELDMEDYVDEVPFIATMNFGEDGTLGMKLRFKDLDAFLAELNAGTVELMYKQFEDLDMTREEADAAFAETYGMSITDYAATIWDAVEWNTLFDAYTTDFVYYAEGDQLYVADSWEDEFAGSTYTLAGDKMTLQDSILNGGTTLELTRAPELAA